MVFFRLCSNPLLNPRSPLLPPSSTLQASSLQSGAICNRNASVNTIIVSHGISISNEDENLLLRQVRPSVFILLGAQYTRPERENKTRRVNRCQIWTWLLARPSCPPFSLPLPSTYPPVTHVSFKITLQISIKSRKYKTHPCGVMRIFA